MRENYEKRLVAVAVVMVMVCMMLTGCGKKAAPADQTIDALFELYIKDNATPMKDLLGFETEEAVVEAFLRIQKMLIWHLQCRRFLKVQESR